MKSAIKAHRTMLLKKNKANNLRITNKTLMDFKVHKSHLSQIVIKISNKPKSEVSPEVELCPVAPEKTLF